jgi:ABC-2 type transport system ATP-binding protein
MDPAILVENLSISYTRKGKAPLDAVRNLSFQVDQGEIVGFLGPNGAGKSTTLKYLMGFIAQASGTASVFGLPAGSEESRRRIGYLPEVAMYYPYLTPLETLRLYGELQGLRGQALKRESQELLDLVGVAAAMNRQNRTLSKGMLQRVGIAQSLLGSPQLLILDEVTSGLDPVGRRELRNLLLERQRAGATLFFSSHELAEVDMLCDRILLIDKGELVDTQNLLSLKETLRQYRIRYSGNISMVGLTDDLESLGDGAVEACFITKESLLEAVVRVQAGGGTILDIIAQEGNLEDYFVNSLESAA